MTERGNDKRFVDSSFDQSASNNGLDTDGSRFAGLVQPSTHTDGSPPPPVRQVPGSDGFRLADTPQTWIFVEKKQWSDDSWTYVVATTDLEVAQEDLSEAQAKVTQLTLERDQLTDVADTARKAKVDAELEQAKFQVTVLQNKVTNLKTTTQNEQSPFDGKVREIDIRTALGNIITRKLDWMNQHEKFSKVSTAVDGVINQLRKEHRGEDARAISALKEAAARSAAENESEAAKAEQTGSRQDRIDSLQAENRRLQESITELENANSRLLAVGPLDEDTQATVTANEEQISVARAKILQNNEISARLGREIESINALQNQTQAELFNELQSIIDSEFAPVTLSGNAFTRYYRAPKTRTLETQKLKDLRVKRTEALKEFATARDKLAKTRIDIQLADQTDRTVSPEDEQIVKNYRAARENLEKTEDNINEELAQERKSIDQSGEATFNGVMELANVPQVSTQLTLEGEGTASFSVENPQNIFFISEDDVLLALSEDPFLEVDNNIEVSLDGDIKLVYYRGRLYPERIVRMLAGANGDRGSAAVDFNRGTVADVFNEVARFTNPGQKELFAEKQLRDLKKDLDKAQQEVADKQAVVNELAQQDAQLGVDFLGQPDNSEVKFFAQQQLSTAQYEVDAIQAEIEQVTRVKQRATREKREKIDQLEETRRILLKYYVGKTIFEVMDRIYIWMTTPTRTPFRLGQKNPTFARPDTNPRFGTEDPSTLALVKQLNATTIQKEAVEAEIERAKQFLVANGFTPGSEEALIPPEPITGPLPDNQFGRDPSLSSIQPKSTPNLNVDQTFIYYGTLREERDRLEGVIRFFETSNPSVSGEDEKLSSSLSKVDIANQTALGEYESRFYGIEERREQVFQGVVSQVKQTYSDGVFKIQVSCKDNLVFLSISRIMVKPALRINNEPIGILQDPIWRKGPLAGQWKNGTLVLDNVFVNDEIQANINQKRTLTGDATQEPSDLIQRNSSGDSEGRLQFTPFATSLPFTKVDAANLVSFIVTGVPYNFEQFIKNASFGGRLIIDQTSGVTDQRSLENSFFFSLRRSIGDQNDRLGDFEPYIDTDALTTQDNIDNRFKELVTEINRDADVLIDKYLAVVVKRMQEYLRRKRKTTPTGQNPADTPANSAASDATSFRKAQDALIIPGKLTQYVLPVRSQEQANTGDTSSFQQSDVVNLQAVSGRVSLGPVDLAPDSRGCRTSSNLFLVNLALSVLDTALSRGFSFASKDAQAASGRLTISDLCINSLADNLLAATSDQGAPVGQVAATILARIREIATDTSKELTAEQQRAQAAKFIREELLSLDVEFRDEYVKIANLADELQQLQQVQIAIDTGFGTSDIRRAQRIRENTKNALTSTVEKIVKQRKKNFLVISDRYELDRSIQAYKTEVSSGNFSIWQSEFEFPLSVCRRAAAQLDFEFFADENGNLRFKPPTYNRILREHFELISQADGPARDAILARYGGDDGLLLQRLTRALSIVNRALHSNQIQLDKNIIDKRNERREAKRVLSQSPSAFAANLLSSLALVAEGQRQGGLVEAATRTLDAKVASLGIDRHVIDDNDVQLLQEIASRGETTLSIEVERKLQQIEASKQRYLNSVDSRLGVRTRELQAQLKAGEISEIDFKKQESEAKLQALCAKDGMYVVLVSNLKSFRDFLQKRTNSTRDNTVNLVTRLKSFFDENHVHRIQNHDLISYDLTEGAPRFTYLEVIGSPELVNIDVGGRGHEFYWSGGVDYDLWRNYGFKAESVDKAYYHSGEAAKVYNRALLGRERGRIFSGSVTVRGDSKYKLGDCIFLQDQAMYYYILGVSHSFQYGQTYTTNLTLSYGRRVGEIIPHPFDVLGGIFIEAYQSDLERLLAAEVVSNLRQEVRKIGEVDTKTPTTPAQAERQRSIQSPSGTSG